MKTVKLLILSVLAVILSGCRPAQSTPSEEGFLNQNLQGQVRSVPYSFVSGYAKTESEKYVIFLLPSDPIAGYDPWEDEAYAVLYPYLSFSIGSGSLPQTYSISTFGYNGICLFGYSALGTGVTFDSGELEITRLDRENHIISGRIKADTWDGRSSVNGNFTVDMEL